MVAAKYSTVYIPGQQIKNTNVQFPNRNSKHWVYSCPFPWARTRHIRNRSTFLRSLINRHCTICENATFSAIIFRWPALVDRVWECVCVCGKKGVSNGKNIPYIVRSCVQISRIFQFIFHPFWSAFNSFGFFYCYVCVCELVFLCWLVYLKSFNLYCVSVYVYGLFLSIRYFVTYVLYSGNKIWNLDYNHSNTLSS